MNNLYEKIVSGECVRGILCCGTGIGISLVCNKYKGIRCALCSNEFMAKMCRQHNDANILAMGGRVIGAGLMLDIVELFLTTEFEGGRHIERLNKISEIEKKYSK